MLVNIRGLFIGNKGKEKKRKKCETKRKYSIYEKLS
jgi:hypothetical protein